MSYGSFIGRASITRASRRSPRSAFALLAAAAMLLGACSTTSQAGTGITPQSPGDEPSASAVDPTTDPSASTAVSPSSVATTEPSSVATTVPPTTVPATTIPPTTAPPTTAAATTTTTTIAPVLDVFDPECVVRTDATVSMEAIATQTDPAFGSFGLWGENGFRDGAEAGELVDVCVGNLVNDIDGSPRVALDEGTVAAALTANVELQQRKLNEIFAGFGTGEIAVDGVSGAITGQRLCAARLALGLDTTVDDMMPGTDEQFALLNAAALPNLSSSATKADRWVLIDRTCQIMFIGSGDTTTFVFPTSTGSEGFETRTQERIEAFRFNPALDNGGWHDSTEFPVGVDNPLNGNLYKPLYFDLGQAIHGANNVPPTPQSKGCARLRVSDQEKLITFLGLDDVREQLWRKDEMNVVVTVQGDFVGR